MTLGRRADQDIMIPEATVSGTHAVFRWQSGSWLIEDLGSTNGTFLDRERVSTRTKVPLGVPVRVGEIRLDEEPLLVAQGLAGHRGRTSARGSVYGVNRDGCQARGR